MSHIEKHHGLFEPSQPNGGSAFPAREITMMHVSADGDASPIYADTPGMSLRAWLAGQALSGVSREEGFYNPPSSTMPAEMIGQRAVEIADATLKALLS